MAPPSYFDFSDVFNVDEYLYFYDETLRCEDTPKQVDFLERELGLAQGAAVIDLGCGHGRHANELARRGHRVLGIDLVPGFIERAQAAAEQEGLETTYAIGDVRALDLCEQFDHAVCLFDSFGFFDDAGNEEFLQKAFALLRPGGHLLLDVRSRDWIVRSLLPFTVLDKEDDMMIDRHHFDVPTGRLVDRRTFVRGGAVRSVAFSIRIYSATELGSLLRGQGFVVEKVLGGYDGEPLSLGKNRMLVLARRP